MMINSLYQLSNKGSLRTLSFILALFLTAAFFLNLNQFSTALRLDLQKTPKDAKKWWLLGQVGMN